MAEGRHERGKGSGVRRALLIAAGVAALIAGGSATAQDTTAPAASATAEAPAQPAAAPPSEDALAAARDVIDLMLPADVAAARMAGNVGPLLDATIEQMRGREDFKSAIRRQPRLQGVFDEFIAHVRDTAMNVARDSAPALRTAMLTAYARRFTVDQLHDIRTFLMTPTGRAYAEHSFDLTSDPGIIQVQVTMGERIREQAAPLLRQLFADIADAQAKTSE